MPSSQWENQSSLPDFQSCTIYTPSVTSENTEIWEPTAAPRPPQSSRLVAGKSYIIQSVLSGQVITFWNGKVVLVPWSGQATQHITRWQCVDDGGWFGFRDPISYGLMAFSGSHICCREQNQESETTKFHVREVGDRTYHLLMPWRVSYSYSSLNLRPIGQSLSGNTVELRLVERSSSALEWRFIEVDPLVPSNSLVVPSNSFVVPIVYACWSFFVPLILSFIVFMLLFEGSSTELLRPQHNVYWNPRNPYVYRYYR
ncbi:unnamed protein product [Periconia digitata]|uniref:Uncharacterized protein n=1 Tax=Periconia digitata TaxID=1303443 RepID=A0A9W4UN68_9PLEO|nr:unnamed protein product [Periconia digitata]